MSDIDTELDACAREAIQIPGAIQPFGGLAVLDAETLSVLQRSGNLHAHLGQTVSLGAPLPLEPGCIDGLTAWAAGEQATFPHILRVPTGRLRMDAHRGAQGLLISFEPIADEVEAASEPAYEQLQRVIDGIEPIDDIRLVGQIVARQVRAMTGFNRVLIYKFDQHWHGTVIAEDGDGSLPDYLDLRFPASDIPAQARALYRRNRIRLIPDADYRPVPIDPMLSPIDGQALDLAAMAVRSVSPVHLAYMRNMRTQASMSVSLIADGRLWGLIACHHRTRHHVAPHIRSGCDFLGRLAAQHIAGRERTAAVTRRMTGKRIGTGLAVELSRAQTFADGLVANAASWLALTGASGAALVQAGNMRTVGATPPEAAIRELAAWLQGRGGSPVFAADSLTAQWTEGSHLNAAASGVLAISISQLHPSYLIWFRPELVRTVTWAGDPRKSGTAGSTDPERLTPRASFEQWKEVVRGRAQPWDDAEVEAAADLRTAIIDVVLRHAEERAALTEKLQLSNRELEAFSYSVSHDLRAPFRHIVGYAELLRDRENGLDATSRRYLDTICDAALSAGQLVDDLLAFSQLNRASLAVGRVDVGKLVAEARASVMQAATDRPIEWRVGGLPEAWGDATMLRQVMLNLLSNAVKYSARRAPAVIEVQGWQDDANTTYTVRDNGIGFDMRYVGKLFGVFQRLHRAEDFEGTGIGLALAKRVIDRHGGSIKAEGELDRGAVFTFSLPRRPEEASLA